MTKKKTVRAVVLAPHQRSQQKQKQDLAAWPRAACLVCGQETNDLKVQIGRLSGAVCSRCGDVGFKVAYWMKRLLTL